MRVGVIVCIVSVVLVCVAALILFIRFKVVKRRNKRKVAAACAGPGASASIFVELIADANADAAAATLAALFETATCSLRVYELYVADEPSAADAYVTAAARSTAAFCLKDHVRCLRVPAREFKGVLSAMEQLRRFLYRGETYIMSIHAGTRFVTGWDTLAIECLADAERQLAARASVVLTTLPASSTNGTAPAVGSLGTYVAVQPLSGAMLAHKLRAKPSSARSTPALAWSSAFSFAKGAALTACVAYPRLHDDAPNGIDTLAHDYFVTLKLLHAGWQLAHPLISLVSSTGSGRRNSAGSVAWRAAVSALNRPLLPSLAARGIMLDAQHQISVSARAAMGLTPDATTDEIIAKLGSIGEYLSVLTRLELDMHAQF